MSISHSPKGASWTRSLLAVEGRVIVPVTVMVSGSGQVCRSNRETKMGSLSEGNIIIIIVLSTSATSAKVNSDRHISYLNQF